MKKSAYILENPDEAKRLEQQIELSAYRLDREFGDLQLSDGSRVLDAGCGTGLVARYLAGRFPRATIAGCDLSGLRVAEAKKLTPPRTPIRYFECPLEAITAPESAYDRIVCRYVLEHVADPVSVAKEFLRVLRPGGEAVVCDFDGLMFNLHPMSERLRSFVDAFLPKIPVDLYIGRKLPDILARAGFKTVSWRVLVNGIQGHELVAERDICAQRISFALPAIAKALDSEKSAREFESLYLEEMCAPNAVLFYNKFVVTGRK